MDKNLLKKSLINSISAAVMIPAIEDIGCLIRHKPFLDLFLNPINLMVYILIVVTIGASTYRGGSNKKEGE